MRGVRPRSLQVAARKRCQEPECNGEGHGQGTVKEHAPPTQASMMAPHDAQDVEAVMEEGREGRGVGGRSPRLAVQAESGGRKTNVEQRKEDAEAAGE